MECKHILLNNQWIKESIKQKIKTYPETNKNESTTLRNLWDEAKAVIRGNLKLYSPTSTGGKNLNKQSKCTPKESRKRTNKTQSKQKKGNNNKWK